MARTSGIGLARQTLSGGTAALTRATSVLRGFSSVGLSGFTRVRQAFVTAYLNATTSLSQRVASARTILLGATAAVSVRRAMTKPFGYLSTSLGSVLRPARRFISASLSSLSTLRAWFQRLIPDRFRDRIYRVVGELRALVVTAEHRTAAIEGENRILPVGRDL